jgi:UDP-2,3-diacylglucosamine pyrophosphatase LpxH
MKTSSDKQHRAVFISDLHLGTRSCNAKALLKWLKDNPSRETYLVGDIIDFWRKASYWNEDQIRVVRHLLKRTITGKVIWVLGNHDEAVARVALEHIHLEPSASGSTGLRIVPEAIFQVSSTEKYLVTHGHKADPIVVNWPLLARVAGVGYDALVYLNRKVNAIRLRLGLSPWSLSKYVKRKAKTSLKILDRFVSHWSSQAAQQGMAGVICGHIHTPCIDEVYVDNKFITYVNTGDWVESNSAVIQREYGSDLELSTL